jgi:hypothetical protein
MNFPLEAKKWLLNEQKHQEQDNNRMKLSFNIGAFYDGKLNSTLPFNYCLLS